MHELRGSPTQIMKSSSRTRQSKAHTNHCALSLSSVLTTKMWRWHQAMLSSVVTDSTIRMHLESLLIYRTAKVHARGSSTSMWESSWFNQHKTSLSVNQSPTPKGVVLLGMVLQVRLLEAGWLTGGALGKAFFPFTFGGALGKAFFPFTFFCGRGGGTWQSLLSLLLLLWHRSRRGGGGAQRGPPPNQMTGPLFSSPPYPRERPKEY